MNKQDNKFNAMIVEMIKKIGILLFIVVGIMSVLSIIGVFIPTQTTAERISANEDYFSGSSDMGNVEMTKIVTNKFEAVVDIVAIIIIVAFISSVIWIVFKAQKKYNEEE